MVPAPDLEDLTQRLLDARHLFDHPDSYAAGVLDTLDAFEELLLTPEDGLLRLVDERPNVAAS